MSTAIGEMLEGLRSSNKLHIKGLCPSARPWLVSTLLSRSKQPSYLWILENEKAAEQAHAAIKFFMAENDRHPSDPFASRFELFPLHQQLPYDDLSPDRFVVAERLSLLFRLLQGPHPQLIISSVQALLRKTMPRTAVDRASILLLQGQQIERSELAGSLVTAGYLNVPLVDDPGTFAIRGGIVDIYTPQLPLPARIELLGDDIESIRIFDPITQRTICHTDSLYIGPVREIVQDREATDRALVSIEELSSKMDLPSHKLLPYIRSIKEGLWFFGIEATLPAFYPKLESLFDYLPSDVRLIIDDPGGVLSAAQNTWDQAEEAYNQSISADNLAFEPHTMLIDPKSLQQNLAQRSQITFGLDEVNTESSSLACEDLTGLHEQIDRMDKDADPLKPLTDLIRQWLRQQMQIFMTASRPDRARELFEMLRRRNLPVRLEREPFDPYWLEKDNPSPPVRIVAGELQEGFSCKIARVAFVPASEIFGRPVKRPRHKPFKTKIGALKPGDFVVHVDFGIGHFDGLCKLGVQGSENDFLSLSYLKGDKLYLPVTRMNLIEPYRGSKDSRPALNKLGGKSWERTKRKVHQALLEMADELIRVQAARKTIPGSALDPPSEDYRSLEASFIYQETEDQERAIRDVLHDLTRPEPMDRLVCGDVGFGKTEVAIRAAYLATLSGKQTAVLVPTTILALQHLSTFRARLDKKAVRVEMACRLVKPSDQKAILADLAEGKVDIIIGTHRLLTKDVVFRSLGLLVIDEEHRFGVKHKENLKKLKSAVDILTLTATPIPRTLQMALSGIHDISVIQTPPPGRKSIRTIVGKFTERVIREAIQLELKRGGQVFFLHNWVQSLPSMQSFINRIVPEAICAVAHGQMNERQLEKVMTDFVGRKIDVLVCTTIIESGLDIPSANTIIVNRADRFGLSQLHQIRGRVGRSQERAYAYFLVPGLSTITKDARNRLEVLSDYSDVGSGYQLSTHDLEMRGAGNLLGRSQSGHVAAVGFGLYNQLLERAVMEIRGQEKTSLKDPEITLPVAGYFPEEYIPDLDQRLDLYARLSRSETEEEVFELEREVIDRYGQGSQEAENLFELTALKIQLRKAGVLSLSAKGKQIILQIDTSKKNCLSKLNQMKDLQPESISLNSDATITISINTEERSQLLQAARLFLKKLI